MAITQEAAAVTVTTGSIVTTQNTSFTVGSGANRVLCIAVALEAGNTNHVLNANFGGVALTQLAAFTSGSTFCGVEIWYLIAPATSTATLTVNVFTSSLHWGFAAYVFDGVNQTTPFRTAAGGGGTSGTSRSDTVTGYTAGDWGLDVLTLDGTSHTPTVVAGQTADYATQSSGAGQHEWRGSNDQANGVMGWTWTTTTSNAHIATALIPVAAAAAGIPDVNRAWR